MRKLLLLVLGLLFVGISPVYAHSNLAGSSPSANESLADAPEEIRLWFTEPLEPNFSRFVLRDRHGEIVPTAESRVDPTNDYQLVMPVDDLPDGLYTVDWRVTSSADGHPSQGSFAFGIRLAVGNTDNSVTEPAIPTDSAMIRWIHLLAMSLFVGGIAFTLLVRLPARLSPQTVYLWGVWGMFGGASVLVLMLQTGIASDISLSQAASRGSFLDVLRDTHFGTLWLIRMAIWLIVGGALFLRRYHLALAGAGAMLFTQSLFSHASAAEDQWASVGADWLHLLATAFWVGGLAAFGLTLYRPPQDKLAILVAAFSDYARIAVALLAVTGSYAAWLQVGSLDALIHTHYGQTLLAKVLLFLPLLGVAGINLLWTSRKIRAGQGLGWLRGLLGIEIALACSILLAVGVLTAGSPARGTQALKDASLAARPEPFEQMEIENGLTLTFNVSPAAVGQNEFTLTVTDESGMPVEDASLIRLRFDHVDMGQSEIRPEHQGAGVYQIEGANLSIPGDWQIRMTLQRPAQFDTVLDFNLNVTNPPQITPDLSIPLSARQPALLLTGLALVAMGGFFLPQGGLRSLDWRKGLAGASLLVGLVFLVGAVFPRQFEVSSAWAYPQFSGMTGAVYLRLENKTSVSETLISAQTEVAESVEFHYTEIESEIASMHVLGGIEIPAGGDFVMEPGSNHLMLINVQRDLVAGDSFEITLNFASGKSITTTVTVRGF